MDKIELVSLAGRGRAETLRMLLVISKTHFLDHRVTLMQWKDYKRREHLPEDTKLPLMRINNKKTIVGSVEIGRYISQQMDLYGSSKKEEREIDEIINLVESLQPNMTPIIRAAISKDYIKKREAWAEYKEKTLQPVLEKLTDKLDDNQFFVGNSLSWADITVAEILSRFSSCFDGNFIHNYPVLKSHMAAIERDPCIARYITDRPSSMF